MAKPEYEFFDPTERWDWTPIEEVDKLHEIVLSKDEDTGSYTRLLRFSPGVNTTPMGEQRHDFWEEVWIVSGAIHDLGLEQTFRQGMYACRPPGMPHGPWTSDEGCITFEQRYYD